MMRLTETLGACPGAPSWGLGPGTDASLARIIDCPSGFLRILGLSGSQIPQPSHLHTCVYSDAKILPSAGESLRPGDTIPDAQS